MNVSSMKALLNALAVSSCRFSLRVKCEVTDKWPNDIK